MNKAIFTERDRRFLLQQDLKKPAQWKKIEELYAQGLPLAYILGKEEFYGYEFKVNPSVLIPRPETELLVEKALEIIEINKLDTVLDLCCGAGNIAIAIKKEIRRDIQVFASDISSQALRLARINAEKHKVNISFVQSDLFASLKGRFFDIIVSNPPYVEEENIRGSLKYEPRLALSGGPDGLTIIKKILDQAHLCLKDEGFLIMEIGYKHKAAIVTDGYKLVEWIKDYSGHFRGVVLKKNG